MWLNELRRLLNPFEGLFEDVDERRRSGRDTSSKTAGHYTDAEVGWQVPPVTRRDVLATLAAATALGVPSRTQTSLEEDDLNPNLFRVRPVFADQLIVPEYSDKMFDIEKTTKDATHAEAALHNSNFFMRQRQFDDLIKNMKVLRFALSHARGSGDYLPTRVLLLHRLMIDNNFIGRGDEAKLYADELATIDLSSFGSTLSGDRTKIRLISRSIDVFSTVRLNTMPADALRTFSDFPLSSLQKWYELVEARVDGSKERLLEDCRGGLRASIFSIAQAKWIKAIRSQPGDSDLFDLRAGWLDDDLFIASGVAGEGYASEIAEDFFYTICRIAFHAAACGDYGHLNDILSYYEPSGPTLPDHLSEARQRVQERLAPNIQWIRLLAVRNALRRKSKKAALGQYEDFVKALGKRKPANAVVGRAMAEVAQMVGASPGFLISQDLLSDYNKVPDVANQLAYYEIVTGDWG